MASMIARELLNSRKVDLVICFAPSVNVSTAFQRSLETHTGARFDGLMGSIGRTLTYHSMLNLKESFWILLERYRALAIFDEIHHCAGNNLGNANAWGQTIIQRIQGRAAFTLALTGTPWRRDKTPIALASYCQKGKILCDSYGLDRASMQFGATGACLCVIKKSIPDDKRTEAQDHLYRVKPVNPVMLIAG